MGDFELSEEALKKQGRNVAFVRWLLATIDRMVCFNPIGLAVAGNARLDDVLGELALLEKAELVSKTGEDVEVPDAKLRARDPSLRPEVNRLDGDDEPVERALVYEKTQAWERSFHPERKKQRRRR